MLVRTISGIVLFVIFAISIVIGANAFLLLLFISSMIAVYELSKVFGIHSKDKKVNALEAVMYLSTIAIYLTSLISGIDTIDARVTAVIIVMILIQLGIYVFTFPKYHANQIAAAIFSVLYAPFLLSFGYRVEAFSEHPYVMTALIFIVSSASDVFAYFVGVTFGKHKLAPVLSPKKSIEGSVGAIVLTSLSCMLYVFCVSKAGYMEMNLGLFAVIGAVGSIISQIGDLAASAIKRNFDIKDYGNLIPGHGGVMDRLDSCIVTMPIIYLILQFIK